MKILNLYAGIGGNRKHWNSDKHDITAVEIDQDALKVYKRNFPEDKVIQEDAHKFLENNYRKYDFIWASPPCPSHSKIRRSGAHKGQYDPIYPDMKLYEEIIFLKHYFKGKWVVENVQSYYEPLIKPQTKHRHYFWSNFPIKNVDINNEASHQEKKNLKKLHGFDLTDLDIPASKKGKMLRNCVHPDLGEAILKSANKRQQKLSQVIS